MLLKCTVYFSLLDALLMVSMIGSSRMGQLLCDCIMCIYVVLYIHILSIFVNIRCSIGSDIFVYVYTPFSESGNATNMNMEMETLNTPTLQDGGDDDDDNTDRSTDRSTIRIIVLPPPPPPTRRGRNRVKPRHGESYVQAPVVDPPKKRLATHRPDWNPDAADSTENNLQYRSLTDPTVATLVQHHLTIKWRGYRQQDQEKGWYDPAQLVTVAEIHQLLCDCHTLCFYCRQPMKVLYEQVRDPMQWTLERIDNSMGHNRGNVQIACLQCNVRRRTMYHERYLDTKRLTQHRIIKCSGDDIIEEASDNITDP